MNLTQESWESTCTYINDLFGDQDDHLASLMTRATAAGIPDIAVNAEVGHLLSILAHGAHTALEIGTLAGYSGIWIARALAPGGRLHTIEFEDKHADFAQAEFEAAGVADRVTIHRGPALEIISSLRLQSVDFAFIDAEKAEYPDYFKTVAPLISPGGVIVADNTVSTSNILVAEDPDATPGTRGVNALNRAIASHPDFEATCVPLRDGLTIARRHV